MKRGTKIIASALVAALLILFVFITYLTVRPVMLAIPTSSAQYLYYFAYGSNMPSRYLVNVRHVNVYESAPGVLADHAIQFSASGLPLLEPAFANLIPSKGNNAYGVLHLIDSDSLNNIICSESTSYRTLQRKVQRLDSGEMIQAWTLVGRASANAATPSRRYLNLMREGASEQHLPAEYRNWLAAQSGAYVPIISELFGTVIYAAVMIQAADAADDCKRAQSNE